MHKKRDIWEMTAFAATIGIGQGNISMIEPLARGESIAKIADAVANEWEKRFGEEMRQERER